MEKINEQLLGRSVLVLVLVIASCFFVAAAFASGEPGSTSSSSTSSSSSSSSSSGGSSGGATASGLTYTLTAGQFSVGYTKEISVDDKFQFAVGEEIHYTTLTSLTSTTATISVASTPQSATLVIGDVRRFELTGDNFYDLAVTLNNVVLVNGSATKAGFKIQSISEEITEETIAEEEEKEVEAQEKDGGEETKKGGVSWLLVAGIILVLVIVVVYFVIRKNRKSRFGF